MRSYFDDTYTMTRTAWVKLILNGMLIVEILTVGGLVICL